MDADREERGHEHPATDRRRVEAMPREEHGDGRGENHRVREKQFPVAGQATCSEPGKARVEHRQPAGLHAGKGEGDAGDHAEARPCGAAHRLRDGEEEQLE